MSMTSFYLRFYLLDVVADQSLHAYYLLTKCKET